MHSFLTSAKSKSNKNKNNQLMLNPHASTSKEGDNSDESNAEGDLEPEPASIASTSEKKGIKRKKHSTVWKYFKKSGDRKFAKCLTCGREYKTSGNTTNLADHLKRFHPTLGADEAEAGNAPKSHSESSSARSSVRSISPFFKRSMQYDSSSKRKIELDHALALMIATDLQPFNIVNDKGFRNFINLLDPKYVIPSKYTIRENIMKDMFTKSVSKLRDILKEVNYVAITTDAWTSVSTESYLAITCHFIDSNFDFKSGLLAIRKIEDQHTAENIANVLRETFVEWQISSKITCIVTDNAANMVKSCELLQKRHLPCFAHSMNLVVQENLKMNCLKEVLTKCKEIVRHFKSSVVASQMFRNHQKENSENEPVKLLQEVSTRWNSTYYMIERILKTEDSLNSTLLKLSKAPPPLAIDDISVLNEIKKCLECFEEATKKISGNKYATISMIIPLSHGIRNYLTECLTELTTEEGKQFCIGLIESVEKRLFLYEKRSVTRIASIIDPRFKKEGFCSSENANQASMLLEQEMCSILQAKDAERRNSGNGNGQPRASPKKSLFSFIGQKNEAKVKSNLADAIIMKRQYLERPNSNMEVDPLLFWKVTGEELDPMSLLCKKYLCIPGTSVESERTFSLAGSVISDRRSRLKDKNVEMLVVLNKNAWLLGYKNI